MDIRVIVFGMCFVLVALFIVASKYVPAAKRRSLKEADFSLAAQGFFQNPNQENFNLCKEQASEYLSAIDSNINIEEFLKREGITFPRA